MTTATLLILGVASICTSVLSATVGMAGGTVLLSILSFFYGFKVLIPLHAAVQLVSNGSRAWLLRKQVDGDMFKPFAFGSIIGTTLGTLLVSQIQDDRWLSLVIAFYIFYELFKPKKLPSIQVTNRGYFWVGILVGVAGMVVGATGLLLGVFILNSSLTKEKAVANQAAMQTFNHLLKLIGFFWIGTDAIYEGPAFLVMSVGAIMGTKIGVHLLNRMPARVFYFLFRGVLFLAAARIIVMFPWQEAIS